MTERGEDKISTGEKMILSALLGYFAVGPMVMLVVWLLMKALS